MTHAQLFTAAQLTTAAPWKQPVCASADEGLKKMGCLHTVEYYSALKKDTLGSHVEKGKHLGTRMSDERNQTPRLKHCEENPRV